LYRDGGTFILSYQLHYTMGTIITSTKAGTCPECKKAYKAGDKIHWDKSVKNSAGYSVVCIDEECFKEQKGTITPRFEKGAGFSTSSKVDVTAELPSVDPIRAELKAAGHVVQEAFVLADEMVKKIYLNLPASDHTYGQIRSKFVDQIILAWANHS